MEFYTNNLAKPIYTYRPYWAKRFGTANMLPMSRAEMIKLGWDSCDIILITGDCYIDHPSFGMALVGRLLEAQGFRVGIIAQPEWTDAKAFKALGKPNLYFGITAGNMDSMVNRYTADRKIRSDDAYTQMPRRISVQIERFWFTHSAVARRIAKCRLLLAVSKPVCAESRITIIGLIRFAAVFW